MHGLVHLLIINSVKVHNVIMRISQVKKRRLIEVKKLAECPIDRNSNKDTIQT